MGAHCCIKNRPTWVESVKESFRTTGLVVMMEPISEPLPVTTERTPAGIPASCPSTASASAEYGVCSAGFTTIVQPVASAGPTLRMIIAAGKVHGVIAAQTPTGSRRTMWRRSADFAGIGSP